MLSLNLAQLVLLTSFVATLQNLETSDQIGIPSICCNYQLKSNFFSPPIKSLSEIYNMRLRGGKRGKNFKVPVRKQRIKAAEATYGLSHFGGEELVVPHELAETIAPTASLSANARRLRKRAGLGIVKVPPKSPDLQLWSPLNEMRVAHRTSSGTGSSILDSDLRAFEYVELCNILNSLNVTSVVDIGSGAAPCSHPDRITAPPRRGSSKPSLLSDARRSFVVRRKRAPTMAAAGSH
jgi:hypothetical protein